MEREAEDLPVGYTYMKVEQFESQNSGDRCIRIREVADVTGAKKWLEELQEVSRVTWHVKVTRGEGRLNIFKQFLYCQHRSNRAVKGKRTSKSTSCPATLQIVVRRSLKKRKPTVVRPDRIVPGWPTVVTFRGTHNHSLSSADILKYRKMSDEARDHLISLFRLGHTPSSALQCRKMELKVNHGEEYESVLADGRHLPSLSVVSKLYRKFIRNECKSGGVADNNGSCVSDSINIQMSVAPDQNRNMDDRHGASDDYTSEQSSNELDLFCLKKDVLHIGDIASSGLSAKTGLLSDDDNSIFLYGNSIRSIVDSSAEQSRGDAGVYYVHQGTMMGSNGCTSVGEVSTVDRPCSEANAYFPGQNEIFSVNCDPKADATTIAPSVEASGHSFSRVASVDASCSTFRLNSLDVPCSGVAMSVGNGDRGVANSNFVVTADDQIRLQNLLSRIQRGLAADPETFVPALRCMLANAAVLAVTDVDLARAMNNFGRDSASCQQK